MVQQQLKDIFAALRKEIPEINGMAIVSSDGKVISHDWQLSPIEPDMIGAVAAAILGLGRKTVKVLAKGDFMHVILESTNGTISVYGAGPRAVLIVGMNKDANIGLLNLLARIATARIAKMLEGAK